MWTRETSNVTVLSFLRLLESTDVKNVLRPSKPLVPKWEKCLQVKLMLQQLKNNFGNFFGGVA